MIRFGLVTAVFFAGELMFWPVCSTALMWATVYWADEALGLLVWCWRKLFPVRAHNRGYPVVLSAPQRTQRHGVQIAGWR